MHHLCTVASCGPRPLRSAAPLARCMQQHWRPDDALALVQHEAVRSQSTVRGSTCRCWPVELPSNVARRSFFFLLPPPLIRRTSLVFCSCAMFRRVRSPKGAAEGPSIVWPRAVLPAGGERARCGAAPVVAAPAATAPDTRCLRCCAAAVSPSSASSLAYRERGCGGFRDRHAYCGAWQRGRAYELHACSMLEQSAHARK